MSHWWFGLVNGIVVSYDDCTLFPNTPMSIPRHMLTPSCRNDVLDSFLGNLLADTYLVNVSGQPHLTSCTKLELC